jgi:hypothetical protein
MKLQRQLGSTIAAVAAAAGAALMAPSTAFAASLPVINVHESGNGFTANGDPLNRQAGRVTFHFTTTVSPTAEGSEVDLVRLNRGYTVANLHAAIAEENSQSPATAAKGTRDLTATARILGGGGLSVPTQSSDVIETLYSGTYYLVDVDGNSQTMPLHVHGTPSKTAAWPHVGATIVMGNGSQDRFFAPAVIPAGSAILIRNSSDTLHFTEFQRAVPGTTDATISKILSSNLTAPAPQLIGTSISAGVVSPGSQVIFDSANLTPGTYVLFCWIADDQTGMPHALMGMHLVIQIR